MPWAQVFWNAGVQMVALNWQTADEPMWVHRGFFDCNGQAGYCLKPPYLRDASQKFDPLSEASLEKANPVSLRVKLLEVRHLPIPDHKSSVTASMSLHGCPFDEAAGTKKTSATSKNNLSSRFDLEDSYDMFFPELATLL
jgi:hypothetical protein